VLDRRIGAARGDRFVIRDQSASRTLGGGMAIDIFPPARGRARPERLAALAAEEEDDDAAALALRLAGAARGLDLDRFAANRNLAAAEAEALVARVPMRAVGTSVGRLGFAPAAWDALKTTVLDALAAWHTRSPDAVGPAEDRVLAGAAGPRVPGEVAAAAVAELSRDGKVVKEGMGVRLATHLPRLAPADAALWRKVAPALAEGGLRPPSLHEIAAALGENAKKLESFLVRAGRLGLVVRIAENRFYRPADLARLAEIAEEIAKESEGRRVAAAPFRDRSGIGRNLAIEVLEYFDRVKFTRRIGGAHQVVRPAAEAFAGARAAPALNSQPRGNETHPGGAPGLRMRNR
jgi:selenocysteine-specific elongation factor